jgi:acetyl esterase
MSSTARTRSRRRPYRLVAVLTAAAMLTAGAGPAASAEQARPAVAQQPLAPCGNPPVRLEPINQQFLNRLAAQGGPPLYTLTPAQARGVLDRLQAGPVPMAQARITRRSIPGGPTGRVQVTIVRPAGVTGRLPGVIYIHGGGWILGDFRTHERLVRQLANGARAAIIFVDYTRSPEARYPVAIEQAYTAARWVAEHGREINVDGSRLAIAGDSVGGNMTAAVTLLAKQRGGPRFVQQSMYYPVTDANFDTPSYRRFANGCWLTRRTMQWFWDAYAPDRAVRGRITASPLRASVAELRGLPRALLITDSDVLLDEGRAYANKLRAAGVPLTYRHYPQIIHDFMMLNALRDTRSARDAVALASTTLRRALYG